MFEELNSGEEGHIKILQRKFKFCWKITNGCTVATYVADGVQ